MSEKTNGTSETVSYTHLDVYKRQSYDIGRYASFPVEVQVGGATIFVIDVEKFIKL